jgi:hypothetical protein
MILKNHCALLLATCLAQAGLAAAAPKVSVAVSSRVISEGRNFNIDFKLSEPAPPAGLTIRLALYRDSDPQLGDVEYFVKGSRHVTGFQLVKDGDGRLTDMLVTLAGNVKSARLTSRVNDDGIAESEERAVFVLAYQGTAYTIDAKRDRVGLTLTDYPVVSIINAKAVAKEGEPVPIFFRLSKPAPKGGLRVRLATLFNSDPAPGDLQYFTAGSSNVTGYETSRGLDDQLDNLFVTIAEGATEAKFYSEVVKDDAAEGRETLTFGLAVGGDYSISDRLNTVTFEYTDR